MSEIVPWVVLFFGGVIAYAVWRRRRRAALLASLHELSKQLGMVVGLQGVTSSSFDGIEGAHIVLRIDGKRLELDLLEALDTQRDPEPGRRWERLSALVRQARARQGV